MKFRIIGVAALAAFLVMGVLSTSTEAAGDVCVSIKGDVKIDTSSADCTADSTSRAISLDGSDAIALEGSTAIAVHGSFALAAIDSRAIAVDCFAAVAVFDQTNVCQATQ